MKLSQRLQDERAYVETFLGDSELCPFHDLGREFAVCTCPDFLRPVAESEGECSSTK